MDYSIRQYQFLMHKTNSLKMLSQTNDMSNNLVRFVAILGKYNKV
jgi:hypothetical protein